jgi:SAM-dependent methyltransferase
MDTNTTAPGRAAAMSYHVHIDPLEAGTPTPNRSHWTRLQRDAWASQEMEAFREGLRLPGLPDIRRAVLDDLSTYFQLDAESCIYGARHSIEVSAKQWLAKPDRSSENGVTDFYLNLSQEYALGILWYAYLQAEGYAYPQSVIIARDLAAQPKSRLLDFGSGVGATALMFGLLGYSVSLADISTPLLDFARYRFERRSRTASFIDLNKMSLVSNGYSVITAVQTLAHVPDISKTAELLHAALVPGGTLYADIDVHPRQRGAQRLYGDDLPGRRAIHHSGFVAEKALDGASMLDGGFNTLSAS